MDVIVNGKIEELPKGAFAIPGAGNAYETLIQCLNFTENTPPLADLLRYSLKLQGSWLIATPIHWEATHNDAMVTAIPPLKEEESKAFFTIVSDFLKNDQLEAQYYDAKHWLFKIDKKPPISSQSLDSIYGQSLMPILQNWDKTLYWQSLFTELQMYLSEHPLNANRALPINGLWFWGEGRCQFPAGRSIATDDPLFAQEFAVNTLENHGRLGKNDVLIIQEPENIETHPLIEKSKKMNTNWYWNNLAYRKLAQSWGLSAAFQRWRKKKHAN